MDAKYDAMSKQEKGSYKELALQEDGEELAKAGTEQPDEDYDCKLAMREFLQTIKWLAINHFSSIPFTMAITYLTDENSNTSVWHWYLWGGWIAGMLLKMGIMTYVSLATKKKMQVFATNYRFQELFKFSNGSSRKGTLSFIVPDWFSKVLFGAPLYIDVDLDMATAVNAWLLASGSTRANWVESWKKVPFIGVYVAEIGLATTMGALVIFATVMQVRNAREHLRECEERIVKWPKASDNSNDAWKKRFLLWQHMGALSDVTSNVLMGELCQCVCIDCCEPWEVAERMAGKEKPHKPPGRGAKFQAKIVYEAAPQMWLQVSFVSQAYGGAHLRTIITGLGAIFTGLCTMFSEIMRNVLRMMDLWHIMQHRVYEVLRMVVVIFIAIACTIRSAGIWFCEDHVFNLSSGCVDLTE